MIRQYNFPWGHDTFYTKEKWINLLKFREISKFDVLHAHDKEKYCTNP